ncbi:MAG TPA: WD40 repeat domain-containing protein, partial [Gemmataceae bacterium]|nr:WD40 repeat domain-containing protein [Gemmataceae bacterium]
MNARFVALSILLLFPPALLAQPNPVVKPLLRLEAGGPSSNVTGLAWSPGGKTLYAAGYDKVVRAWRLDPATGVFALDDAQSFRVPIGPGIDGSLNALAVSPDGIWLATGGFGIVEGGMKFGEAGYLVPVKGGFTPAMRQERGLIYVFNTKDKSVKILKGHTGPILNLAFAAGSDTAPKLISAAEGWDAQASKNNGEAIAWDVVTEKALGKKAMPELKFARRPGLAATVKDGVLRAFLAWENGTLADWNVTTDKFRPIADNQANVAVALRGDRLLTSSLKQSTGRIEAWKVAADLTAGPVRELATDKKAKIELPLALAWLGDSSAAAVILATDSGAPMADLLEVIDTRAGTFGQRIARIALAQKNSIVPVIAADRGGTHVAVAGFPDHTIRVFPVADLAAAAPKVQILKSAGSTMRTVRFVKKGAAVGLEIGNKKAEAVYDFAGRKLATDLAAWAGDEAVPGPYALAVAATGVTVTKAGAAAAKIPAKKNAFVTTAKLYVREQTPMVAIASYMPTKGTTLLELYDGTTGVQVRSFTGHLAPIRGLSFRGDGKLLASVAEDQTLSVWSLTDLKDTIGLRGGLGEAAIETRNKELVVTDPAGVLNLQDGDKIAGLYGKNAFTTFDAS